MKNRLVDFIKTKTNETYFNSLITRFLLARELMYEYNDELIKNSHIARNMTPFMNIYNIYLEETEIEDDQYEHYVLKFPTTFSDVKDQYTNFLFGDPRLFTYKMKPEQKYNCTNGKVLSICKQNNAYAIHTIGTILFYIYFGYHPFLGQKYYENTLTDNEYNRIFFQSRPKFIFDFNLNKNPNRFINGYHSKAYELWNAQTESQKTFWQNTFIKKFITFNEFYENWQINYGNFTISNMQTICNETLDVIMINEQTPLIISDNKISLNTINCYKCNNALINNCENCKINSDLCTFLNQKASLTFKNTKNDNNLIINLYPEKIISIPNQNKDTIINLFKVIKSKKIANLLGLKILTDKDIKAIYNNEEKSYQKDDIIPLFTGIKIIINDPLENIGLSQLEIVSEGEKTNE